ncbi:MAG TPA: NAD(P)H-hydrate dehydratase [Verrucomicrobiae bacterium]
MSLPVISVAQMREWENATWASGQTEAEVIRRVGKAVASHALQLTRDGDFILLLAGKGHNGDDVRAAREHLPQRRVKLLEVTDPKTALAEFVRCGTGILPDRDRLEACPTLIVDGLFGIGLNRSLDNDWIKFIEAVNESGIPVLAVDVPSGLNADTGESFGAVVRAMVTLTVGAPKRGLLSPAAWDLVGRLEIASDVGLVRCPHQNELNWTLPEDFSSFPPARAAANHKGTFGHLAIIAGSLGYHGAAVLATRAAQRARPGLVTVLPHEPVYFPIAAQLQSAMVRSWSPDKKLLDECSAVLVGPGLAAPDLPEEMKSAVRRQWRDYSGPMIMDASGLDWLAQGPTHNAIRVITPHPGEAARLLRASSKHIQANRVEAVRELSRRHGNCWVVLKGHQTLVGRSAGGVFVNSSGNAGLAQGGSGDALAGFLAGLLAQPALQADPLKTIRYAVWQHGAAADWLEAAKPNWVVEDLVEKLGAVG